MMTKEQKDEKCDARNGDRSTEDDKQILFRNKFTIIYSETKNSPLGVGGIRYG